MPRNSNRIPALDGVRGIAILMVLSFHWIFASLPGWHSPDLTLSQSIIHHIFMLNWIGVDLFFVLSGFLIGGIILDNGKYSNFYSVFYVRRACRILPLYIVLLLTLAVVSALLPWREDTALAALLHPISVWPHLLFIQNLVPASGNIWTGNTWSLAIEEQFYILSPFLLLSCPKRFVPHALCAGILISVACRLGMLIYFGSAAGLMIYPLTFCRMDTLLIGILAAWAIRDEYWSKVIADNMRIVRWTVLMMVAVLVGFIIKRWSGYELPMASFGYKWVAAMCAGFIMIACYDQPAFLSWNVLRLFGRWAYSMYLFHRPLGALIFWIVLGREQSIADPVGILVTAICLAALVGVAAAAWRWIEAPIIHAGHRFRYGPRIRVSPVLSPSS